MPKSTKRGGLRNPPGGRPRTTTSGERREKYSVSLDPKLVEWAIGHYNQSLSNVVERLLQERKDQDDGKCELD